jgi:predicted nucleic acid-binding protein
VKNYVLDSYAVLAYLEGEESGREVVKILEEAAEDKAEIFLSVVNWAEMCYIALREGGNDRAASYIESLANRPIELAMVDEDTAFQAALFKAHNKMSLADAFAAALSKAKDAVLVTGDPEFRPLEKQIAIRWLK